MNILKAAAATVAVLVLCGAGCGSAPTPMVADRPIISAADAPPVPSDISLALVRTVIFVPRGTQIGVESCGGVGIGTPITWVAGDRPVELSAYRAGFNQEMGAAGYKVDQTRSVFSNEQRGAAVADLVIGASIPEMKVNRCDPRLYAAALGMLALTMQRSADATISVDWEVLDATENKVIFRTRTEGQGTASRNAVSIDVAIQTAFQQAARNLSRDPNFRALVAKYKRGDVIAGPGPGEPMGPSGAPSAAADAAPAHYTIANVPLSTKPFSENATDIRMHVGTVLVPGATGSGFFIADDMLLTNHHVVMDQRFVKVRTVTGRELVGEVLTSNTRRDVALVKTEKTGLKGLPIRNDEVGVGGTVFVIGSPFGIANESTVTSGIVSAYREIKGERYIQSDTTIQHGNSGGPMFDDKGNLIGISVAGLMAQGNVSEGINYFIPINEALQTLNITKRTAAGAAVSSR